MVASGGTFHKVARGVADLVDVLLDLDLCLALLLGLAWRRAIVLAGLAEALPAGRARRRLHRECSDCSWQNVVEAIKAHQPGFRVHTKAIKAHQPGFRVQRHRS